MAAFAGTFDKRGYLAIEELFDPLLIEAVEAEYQTQLGGFDLDRMPPHLAVGKGRVQVPIELKGPLLDPMLCAHPLLLHMVEAILGKDLLVDSLTCVTAFPGAPEQELHRDHPPLFPTEENPSPCFALSVAVPLIDLTPETGSTRVFPGTHLTSEGPNVGEEPAESETSYLARGGCYFMDYRLWHKGAANRSDRARPVLYIIYARPWFTDLVNFRKHERIRLAKDDLVAMPTRQRTLFRRLAAKGSADLTEAELLG